MWLKTLLYPYACWRHSIAARKTWREDAITWGATGLQKYIEIKLPHSYKAFPGQRKPFARLWNAVRSAKDQGSCQVLSRMELANSSGWEVGSIFRGNASSTPAPMGLPPFFGVEIFLTANTTADAEISNQGLSEVSPTFPLEKHHIYLQSLSIVIFRNPIFGTVEFPSPSVPCHDLVIYVYLLIENVCFVELCTYVHSDPS